MDRQRIKSAARIFADRERLAVGDLHAATDQFETPVGFGPRLTLNSRQLDQTNVCASSFRCQNSGATPNRIESQEQSHRSLAAIRFLDADHSAARDHGHGVDDDRGHGDDGDRGRRDDDAHVHQGEREAQQRCRYYPEPSPHAHWRDKQFRSETESRRSSW